MTQDRLWQEKLYDTLRRTPGEPEIPPFSTLARRLESEPAEPYERFMAAEGRRGSGRTAVVTAAASVGVLLLGGTLLASVVLGMPRAESASGAAGKSCADAAVREYSEANDEAGADNACCDAQKVSDSDAAKDTASAGKDASEVNVSDAS